MSNEVKKYFSKKAKEYDLVDEQIYWVLSDKLAKKILNDIINKNFYFDNIKILDAGVGTGRWTINLLKILEGKKVYGDLVDITPEMLNETKNKIEEIGLEKNFNCIEGNIENLDFLKDNSYNIALSFYNVLSFVGDYKKAIGEIYDKLKEGGKYIGIVANKYHSAYFSILTNRINELEKVKNGKIRFNDLMPYIHCFSPNELKQDFLQKGFKDVKIYGLLNFIYPGMEETFLKGQTEQKVEILSNKENFDKILELEYENCYDENLSCRGNTLLFIATK